jgi:hypothetical protein
MDLMSALKEKLRSDLSTAMKARDELRTRTLRMALTAVSTEEVAGKQARELSDDEIVKVLAREAKKRREAAEAFAQADRAEQAQAERDEGAVLDAYLPAQLSDDELHAIVGDVVAETGASSPNEMGRVMSMVMPRIQGRADGKRVSNVVKEKLTA